LQQFRLLAAQLGHQRIAQMRTICRASDEGLWPALTSRFNCSISSTLCPAATASSSRSKTALALRHQLANLRGGEHSFAILHRREAMA